MEGKMSVSIKKLTNSIEEQTDLENAKAQAARNTAYCDYLMMQAGVDVGETKEGTEHAE
jgi:hypothetical protein